MTQATTHPPVGPRNRFGYGLGTLGRDAMYGMVATYLMVYLTEARQVSTGVLAAITVIMVATRVLDAVADPLMGIVVDNTHTRIGKFKPWIIVGALLATTLTVMLFTDWQVSGVWFVVLFAVLYMAWSISWTTNDVAYWSMLPSLSRDPAARERIGSFARIIASIGAFGIALALVPGVQALGGGDSADQLKVGYFWLAVIVSVALIVFQAIMVLLVREDRTIVTEQHTKFRELYTLLARNDQLMWAALTQLLYQVAFTITQALAYYYMVYIYGDENMYTALAAAVGVATLGALAVYPLLAKRLTRSVQFSLSLGLTVLGYLVFFFAPNGVLIPVLIAALLVFVGTSWLQMLMLMFLTDSVEYGQWKLGRRNESANFALQPFVWKLSGGLANGVVGVTLIIAGISNNDTHRILDSSGQFALKTSMLLIPLALMVLCYLIYRRFYTLDETRYAQIVAELESRAAEQAEPSEPAGS
jgi:sugar (glycoside-pentoside-hexuronide) transporter